MRSAIGVLAAGWQVDGADFSGDTGVADHIVAFHGVAAASRDEDAADSSARLLFRFLAEGGLSIDLPEDDLRQFLLLIFAARVRRRWLNPREVETVRGEFGTLLGAAGKPSFRDALEEYCDFRVSRSYQFPDRGANKVRKPSEPLYFFETQWYALWPVELFALAGSFRAATGRDLPLVSAHPLLNTCVTQPKVNLGLRSSIADEITTFASRRYGLDWKSKSTVEVPERLLTELGV